MTETQIKFTDGAGYERYMGLWSQLVGREFLAWLTPAAGLRWLDVGCGNGAFTEIVAQQYAPQSVDGIDPSEGQLTFARTRPDLSPARFVLGDAMALPYPDRAFDIAVMPLVIFFVPDPFKGVAEMTRVVQPGGIVSAYGWDLTGGGFPYAVLQEEMKASGVPVGMPPTPDAARLDRLAAFWTAAGLTDIETREIQVQRTFADSNNFWTTVLTGPSLGPGLSGMPSDQLAALKARVHARLPADGAGGIPCSGRAHAIRGRVALP